MTPGSRSGDDARNGHYLLAMLCVLAATAAYRATIAATHGLGLNVDEAQYWLWAQSLEWGYFSKPPMIAATIWLPTQFCGNGEMCIRAIPLIAYPLTALLVYATARHLYGSRVALVAGVAFVTLPGVSFSSLIISTDVPLFLFWTLALFAFVHALSGNQWRHWLLAGAAGGLGLLTKYTMGVFAVSAALFLLLSREDRRVLLTPRPYAGAALAGVIWLPNLLWNIRNDYPTLRHTAQISNLDSFTLHWSELGEFLAGQLIVFGPVLLVVFLASLLRGWSVIFERRALLLYCFSLPFLTLICLQALFGRANANWAAPSYVGATLLVAGYLVDSGHRGKAAVAAIAIAMNVLLGAATYHYDRLLETAGMELHAATDPFKRYRGWDRFANGVAPVLDAHPDAILMGDERDVLAKLIYYLDPHPLNAVVWNPGGSLRTHFHLTTTLDDKRGRNFILVTDRDDITPMQRAFTTIRLIDELSIPVHRDWHLRARIFHLENFLGYEQLR